MINLVRPKMWENRNILSYLLLPLSLIYWLCYRLRWLLTKPYKSKSYTICVGNASVGGSGKTPIVASLAKKYLAQHKKTCIISRGYRGNYRGPLIVDLKIHNYKEVGDESLILAAICTVIISKDRVSGIKLAEDLGYETIICDDGLQNPTISYDLRILSYNKQNIGNGFILPTGPLREDLYSAMQRVDYIFTNDVISYSEFNDKITGYEIVSNFTFDSRKKYFLYCGIANPEKFFLLAQKMGCITYISKSYEDHHEYTRQDIDFILSHSQEYTIVTTEKDYVKLSDADKQIIQCMKVECFI